MKKINKITLYKIEALGDFQDHIGLVMKDLDEYDEYIPKNKRKKYRKCYETLSEIWQVIETNIEELCDGDKRFLNSKSL